MNKLYFAINALAWGVWSGLAFASPGGDIVGWLFLVFAILNLCAIAANIFKEASQ